MTMSENLSMENTVTRLSKPTGLGQKFKTAREALRLNEREAAARLHLNPDIIFMIENETFDTRLPDTFLRGYVRSYGRLLNFSENEIQNALHQMEAHLPKKPVAPPIISQPPKRIRLQRYAYWIAYGVAGLMVALVGIWWSSHTRYNITDVPAKTINNMTETISQTPASPVTTVPSVPKTVQAVPAKPAITGQPSEPTPTTKISGKKHPIAEAADDEDEIQNDDTDPMQAASSASTEKATTANSTETTASATEPSSPTTSTSTIVASSTHENMDANNIYNNSH